MTVLVVMALVLSGISLALFSRSTKEFAIAQYEARSVDLARTLAVSVDGERARALRDAVMEVYESLGDDVVVGGLGSSETDAYLEAYAQIEQSEDFRVLQEQLRTIQDVNPADCVYLLFPDVERGVYVYMVDAAYEENCPPGYLDYFTEQDQRLLGSLAGKTGDAAKLPDDLSSDITNTSFGWLVTGGAGVHDEQEDVVAYACTDYSMDAIIAEKQRLFVQISMMVLLASVACIAFGVFLVNRHVVDPIKTLTNVALEYYHDEDEHFIIRQRFSTLEVHTGDEIEMLASSMAKMEQDINQHIVSLIATTDELESTKELADEMNTIAMHDALTKTFNKRAYDIELARINEQIQAGNHEFGIVMIDLNYLKRINDTYGHEKGDIAIRTLANLIMETFPDDQVFRVGGDEFAVVLRGDSCVRVDELVRHLEAALAARQRDQSLEPWEQVSAAVGYALVGDRTHKSMDSAFKRADKLMYHNKRAMKAQRNS